MSTISKNFEKNPEYHVNCANKATPNGPKNLNLLYSDNQLSISKIQRFNGSTERNQNQKLTPTFSQM